MSLYLGLIFSNLDLDVMFFLNLDLDQDLNFFQV